MNNLCGATPQLFFLNEIQFRIIFREFMQPHFKACCGEETIHNLISGKLLHLTFFCRSA